VCPPAALVDSDGLPATSTEAIRNSNPDRPYPVSVQWSGILPLEPEDEERSVADADIVHRVRAVLRVLWRDDAADREIDLCRLLAVKSLRQYLATPTGFFDDHLRRYSKSRRQAPIYWPLSTASGSYSLWIYYPRLDADLLYKAVHMHVAPKIDRVRQYLTSLEKEPPARGREGAARTARTAALTELLGELSGFKQELLQIADLPYRPSREDGVAICAAPLRRFFRLPRWRRVLEEHWQALQRGDYDWAHLALATWPDRVREKCRHDRSRAIAPGLEPLHEETPEEAALGKIGSRRKGGMRRKTG
jgi:hypothetical protein